MQNDFVEDDGWFVVQSRGHPYTSEQKAALYGNCRALAAAAHEAGMPVIYASTVLRADGLDSAHSRRRADAHPVEETWGAQIVEGLKPEPRDIVLRKNGPSAFQFTALHRILRNLDADSLILAGGPLYEGVNATGRDGSAYGYASFAVPEAIYPIDYPNPQFLRMRMHNISLADALDRLRKSGAESSILGTGPALDWRGLLSSSCLLLIDLQNGFVRPEGFLTGPHELWPEYVYREEEYQRLLANNTRLIQWAHGRGMPVINARAVVRRDAIDSALYADSQRKSGSCVRPGGSFVGDWNSEFAEEIAPSGEDIELVKHGHSAFAFTILDRMLSNLGVKQCIVSGGNIAGCVEETLRDGAALGYSMLVVRDATYRPGDPRIDLMAEECAIVAMDDIVGASQ